jgi:hypothetical protein
MVLSFMLIRERGMDSGGGNAEGGNAKGGNAPVLDTTQGGKTAEEEAEGGAEGGEKGEKANGEGVDEGGDEAVVKARANKSAADKRAMFKAALTRQTQAQLFEVLQESGEDLTTTAADIHDKHIGSDITKREPTPLVTGLLNTLNNRPFTQLLPAWMCDSVNFSVISSLIMYYVQYGERLSTL